MVILTKYIARGDTPIDSLMNAEVLASRYVLVATCDIPLLTIDSVADFKRCSKRQADVYYPVIPKDVNDRLYPGVKGLISGLKTDFKAEIYFY